VRLHAQLIMTAGPLFDEPFPIEFRPAELSVADK
jgi:hypothetical protein